MGLTDTGWLKAAKTTSLRRRIHCDVICHTTARRRSWQLSPNSDIGPSDPTLPGHSRGQYLVGTIPRSIRICVPNLVMIGPAVWPPILDRHTHTQNLYYIDTSWIPGFARDPLSRSLSPSLSRPSLPSLQFVPAFYPPSLGLPGFAQDSSIPEILFKPWSLVTFWNVRPYPPPVGWGGVGVTCFGYFFRQIFFFIDFLGSSWNFPHFWNFDPPTSPRDAGPRRMGWGGGYMFWLFFRQNFVIDFLGSFVKFPALLKFWPPTPPPPGTLDPVGWGGVGVTCFGYFFGRIFFYRFSRQFVKFPALLKFWPPTPPPGTLWTTRGGVGKNLFYWFSGHSWVSLTLVDWRQRKRRHYVVGFIVTSFATQRLAEEGGS